MVQANFAEAWCQAGKTFEPLSKSAYTGRHMSGSQRRNLEKHETTIDAAHAPDRPTRLLLLDARKPMKDRDYGPACR
ncbi:hypothetical protein MESS4_640117 [Mesorhizobium sp. STM 4661]|nr:hypothetical protein MESS4_640117 [Mesorhizobium sp. STM 4661]